MFIYMVHCAYTVYLFSSSPLLPFLLSSTTTSSTSTSLALKTSSSLCLTANAHALSTRTPLRHTPLQKSQIVQLQQVAHFYPFTPDPAQQHPPTTTTTTSSSSSTSKTHHSHARLIYSHGACVVGSFFGFPHGGSDPKVHPAPASYNKY